MKQPGGKIRILRIAIPFAISVAILAGKPSSARAQLADSPWPMVYHDARHTSRSQYDTSSNTGTVKWKFPLPYSCCGYYGGYGPLLGPASPAIGADGTIYAGAADSNFYAINPNGTEKWAFPATNSAFPGDPYGTFSPAAIAADGTAYFGASTLDQIYFSLYALNPDGTQKWNLVPPYGVNEGPAIVSDGTIWAATSGESALQLSPDGTIVWAPSTLAGDASAPAIGGDGTAYVRSMLGLRAFPSSGPVWDLFTGESFLEGPLIAPAVAADGTIYVGVEYSGSYPGLNAINPDGSQKWNFTDGDNFGVLSTPAVGADGTIYVGGGDLFGSSGNLYAVDSTGTLKWSFPTGAYGLGDYSISIGSDGTIYAAPTNGNLYAINSDGTQKWVFTAGTHSFLSASAIGVDGTIYVSASDGYLYAIGPTAAPAHTSALVVSPLLGLLRFGAVEVGSSLVKTVTLRNTGAHPLFINGVTSSNPTEFTPGASTCPAAGLGPHASCTIAVTFQPNTTGARSAKLTIDDNAGDGAQKVLLWGFGGTRPHGGD